MAADRRSLSSQRCPMGLPIHDMTSTLPCVRCGPMKRRAINTLIGCALVSALWPQGARSADKTYRVLRLSLRLASIWTQRKVMLGKAWSLLFWRA